MIRANRKKRTGKANASPRLVDRAYYGRVRPMVPHCTEALVQLARDLAACRTFEELSDMRREEYVKPFPLDELIERARSLVDDYGLHEA